MLPEPTMPRIPAVPTMLSTPCAGAVVWNDRMAVGATRARRRAFILYAFSPLGPAWIL